MERWFSFSYNTGPCQIALDLSPEWTFPENNIESFSKTSGSLNIIFLSRITPKKNLDYALNVLQNVKGSITFDIYGPIYRDKEYWEECKRIIARMPGNVSVSYKGVVNRDEIQSTFSGYHVFFFPTRGENYGHVIMESLSAGCPLLISDQTPWRGLEEKNIGWDIPLSNRNKFRFVLNQLVDMEEDEFKALKQSSINHAVEAAGDEYVLEQNRQLFFTSVNRDSSKNEA
ncbi:glycosyltransferase [Candidatus Latescibacterota bacterium]